ncbi:hypothetical protein NLN94_21745 [Citrobacter portucalensis]|uniref:hypothetical protein n=1 Tax=Citrobacter portucalensis TaxID=1639133 RepID=UPI00226B4D37|nr:hypothetical protein [Citrobacter portucalensis]MCX9063538.1 hypothetical protein [Citrobacter portucalensis]
MATNRKHSCDPFPAHDGYDIDSFEDQTKLARKKYTQEELARITPRGKCITASKEDVFAIVLASARKTKRPKDPIIEAIGSAYKIAK